MKKNTTSKSKKKTERPKSSQKSKSRGKGAQKKVQESQSDQSSVSDRNTSNNRKRDTSQDDLVAFNEGTYIAFVDPLDNLEQYKLALLRESLMEDGEEVLVDIYSEMAPQTFKRESSNSTISSSWIISQVKVTIDKRSTKAKHIIAITKQQENKVVKLMENVVKNLQEQSEEDNEESDEEGSESEQESSEEEEESSEELKRDTVEQIKARRMVKANKRVSGNSKMDLSPIVQKRGQSQKKAPAQTQPVQKSARGRKPAEPKEKVQKGKQEEKKQQKLIKEEESEEEKVQQNKKSLTRQQTKEKVKQQKTPSRTRKQDEEMEKEEEEEDSIIQINTDSKKKAIHKIISKTPQVGQKRRRVASIKKSKKAKKGDDENEEMEDENSQEDVNQAQKKRKMAGGVAEKVKKAKVVKVKQPKVQKKPLVFKKGKWNPDIELVESDKYLESTQSQPIFDCCIRCNNKNLIRAAVTDNETLLKECLKAKNKISSLTAIWSPDFQQNALDYMGFNNQHDMFEILLHPKLKVPLHSTYENERIVYYNDRVRTPPYLMEVVDTGMVSNMAYGARVRKVQMTRGNRQGNNAFMEYHDDSSNPYQYLQNDAFLKKALQQKSMTQETYEVLWKLNPNMENQMNVLIYEAVRAGNQIMAYESVKRVVKYPNWGFSTLHEQVLNPKTKQLEKFVKASVTKKANTNIDITPIHCACINPNVDILKQLLDVNPEINVPDQQLRRLSHYAAACISSGPIEFLIQKGINLFDVDNQKKNCLHVACITGRAECARVIIQTNPTLMKGKDKQGNIPLAYALEFGHTEVLKVFLEFKAKINTAMGLERMPPLHYAATYGHYDLAKFILENKGRTLGKDKYKRTALIMAAKNGFTKLASLLLQYGAEWDHQDSSKNTALHYAAAFGSLDCMDLLLKAGADVNSSNSWKITPINIAMLKNHQGAVKKLLDQPNVDVNCKDEKGRTLLLLALISLNDESYDFIKYLLLKGADPNIADQEGRAAMHYIAQYNPSSGLGVDVNSKAQYQKNIKIQIEVAKLLLEKGGDLSLKDGSENTAFAICLSQDNAPILEFLQDQVSLNKEPQLFFQFSSKIFNVAYQKILFKLLKNDIPNKECINCLNSDGYTPFLKYIDLFVSQSNGLISLISQKVNAQFFIHGAVYDLYEVTNADLFDKFADQQNYHKYTSDITEVQKQTITMKFFNEIIVAPFIELLKNLIQIGADPQAQVQKLKRYRDEEAMQKDQISQLQINANAQKLEETVRKRNELLKERAQRLRGRGKAKSARRRLQPAYQQNQGFNFNNHQELDFNGQPEKFDNRDGEKVLRKYGPSGLRNAYHLILGFPHSDVFDYFQKLKINPDVPDYDEVTPFNLLSSTGAQVYSLKEQEPLLQKFLQLEVRIDYPDVKGRTPFLNYYGKSDNLAAFQLLDLGANVNQIDASGMFAMKYSLLRRSNNELQNLLDRGANINQIDNKGRNLLHHAVNMSSASSDATFETEQFIIDNGVELNLKDYRGRTPLHYAFVKIQNWNLKDQIDPIETVSSLCGCKGLEMDVADKWLKTPLHYASQRGASVCAVYLINRGANPEKIDIYGNCPLGVALLNGHYNYGIILIEKNLDVNKLVFHEDYKKINKMWEEEAKLYKLSKKKALNNGDVEMDKEDKKQSKQKKSKKKAHRDMFGQQHMIVDEYYGEEYDNEDEEEDYDSDDYRQETAFNQQNAFGQNVFNNPFQNQNPFMQSLQPSVAQLGALLNLGRGPLPSSSKTMAVEEQLVTKLEEESGVSMFKLSIRAGQQGLAYLILDKKYDLMLAMQDSMDEKKFMLVLTLLSKNPDDSIVQQTNKKGQNLFHILSKNAGRCPAEHLGRIYQTLLKRGVNCKAKDLYERTALHYAVISHCQYLVTELLSQNEYDVNGKDVYGHTPFSLCIEGANGEALFNSRLRIDFGTSIFTSLCQAGANVNIVYPEKLYGPAFKKEDLGDENEEDFDYKEDSYRCTALIHLVRQIGQKKFTDLNRENIITLITKGAKLNVVDTDGRDAVIYSIMNNNLNLLLLLLTNKVVAELDMQVQDRVGRSAVHYVVNPIKYGTYENVKILNALFDNGYPLTLVDIKGKSPIQYAQEYESGVLLNELVRLRGITKAQLAMFTRANSMIVSRNWPESKIDFEHDSEMFMEEAKKKEELEYKEKKNKVPVDPTGVFEKSYEVYYENELPWDVYLTKVDLKNGIYGDYVFYKMQLLYDKNRDLFVVFTRWGRIGETGMNQRTPFSDVEEAKLDYKKIFKQKTGGNEFDQLDQFQKKEKKYTLTKINYVTVDFKDYLAPFDYEKVPKSRLNQKVFELYEEISNVTMYQRAMSSFGVDLNVLPFSAIKKEMLIQARQILGSIKELVDEDIELSKLGIRADYKKLTEVKEKVSELTSRYYEIIPLTQYKNQIAPPLGNHRQIQLQYDNLENLTQMEYASKILLGALYRQHEMNPVDYVYEALNIKIEAMDNLSPEYEVINTYINNTRTADNRLEVQNIFKIQRKGEAELMQTYKDLDNHFLLYHGSMLFNYMGILSQGLRIAPPEAPPTGYMFGKGVYFADLFDKSAGYAQRGYNQQDSYLMLMCEVALGKSKELTQPFFVEKLEPQFNSVKGVGRRGPGYKHTVTLPNGVKIPYGPQINYFEQDQVKQNSLALQHNEYIVYNTSQVRMRYLIQIGKVKK